MGILKREGWQGMWDEFKKFLARGNMIDLAVGIVVGGAFKTIVTSLVNDIIMPPIGLVLGRVNFRDLFVSLDGKPYESLTLAKEAGAATMNYGVFINTVVDFLITALVVFLLIRQINRLQELAKREKAQEEAAAPPAPTAKKCPYCFSEIPIQATRCPNCTSHLEVPQAEAA